MLDESELNIKEPGVDQIKDRSIDSYVDDLLNKHRGVPEDALIEVQQLIKDGYNDKNLIAAKQKLQNILEKSKNMSKTRKFMEELKSKYCIDEGNFLTDKEKEKLGRVEKINTLIDNGIPPSVYLNGRELIFKTTLKNTSKIEKLQHELKNPFMRASEKASKQQQLQDLQRNTDNFYIFRVIDVTPKEVITSNYYAKAEPKKQPFSFEELKNILHDPVNSANAKKAYKFFPEDEDASDWKLTIWGDQNKINANFEEWLNQNKDRYQLDKYTKPQLNYLFKANVVYQHSMEQAINDLQHRLSAHKIGDLTKAKGKKQDMFMPHSTPDEKPYLASKESVLKEDEIVYRDSSDKNPENIQKMYDYLTAHGLKRNLIEKPFIIKNGTEDISKNDWYIVTGTPFDDNYDRIRVAPVEDSGKPQDSADIEMTLDKFNFLTGGNTDKYFSTSNADVKNIKAIREYLERLGIDDDYIDMPFIVKNETPKNKWAAKGNKNIFTPEEHRYIITGVPMNPEVKTLRVKEILPTGMKGIVTELPIETIKNAIINNPVDKRTMIDPRNGNVIDIPLDMKLRATTYKHGAQGRFHPVGESHVIEMLKIAQRLKNEDGSPLYAFDLVQSYMRGRNSADIKNAMKDMWELFGIKLPLESKTVQSKVKFYYAILDIKKRPDPTNQMVKNARRKEGMF